MEVTVETGPVTIVLSHQESLMLQDALYWLGIRGIPSSFNTLRSFYTIPDVNSFRRDLYDAIGAARRQETE